MATYALSLYGEDFYGADVYVSYSVEPMDARQTGYGEITVTWVTPVSVQNWGELRLVRNTSGFPVSEDDGDTVLQFNAQAPQNSFTDSGLTGGKFYYYSVFLSSEFQQYSSTATYQPGDTVSYGGFRWTCTTSNVIGVAPGTGVAQWQITQVRSAWNRAGQAASLAVRDYGYRDLLYQLIPTAYATAQTEVSAPQDPTNDVFYRYMSVLAWGLSITRTELGEQQNLHRVSSMPLSRLELLASQLGVSNEASVTPRLRRYRVEHAADLGQRRGTLESVKETIYDLTGYDSDISISRNLMLDADQAEAYYPRWSSWDASINYQPGAVVQYGDYLYSAKSATVREEAELLPITLSGVPSYVIQEKSSGSQDSNQQVLFRSNAINQAASLTFTVPATGPYDLAVGMTKSYDYGIVRFEVDGQSVHASKWAPIPLYFDGYAKTPSPATSILLGTYTLTAGTHTIKFVVARKNGNSGKDPKSVNNGYQMGVDFLSYTPSGANTGVGVAPSGTTANNAFWTRYTAALSNALDNHLTGGVSSWEQVSFTAGANPSNDNVEVLSGYQQLSGGGDFTRNILRTKNGTGVSATLGVHSIPRAMVTPWNETTVYQRNAYVSHGGRNYLALIPSVGVSPDVDRTYWTPETISTTGADRYLVTSYGIPLAANRVWSPGIAYNAGDTVEFRSQLFRASTANKNASPSAALGDNAEWAWVGPAQSAYSASAWTSRLSGSGSPTRSMYIEWYDQVGNLISTITPATSYAPLHVPFTRAASDYLADPLAAGDLYGRTWSKVGTDTPRAGSGMLYWATRNSNQNAEGRHLVFSFNVATGISLGLTFSTEPPPGTEHGLVFRSSNSLNCWTVSRTRIAKMVSGTLTTMASWAPLPDGSRIRVNLNGSSIQVLRYQGAGLAPVQLGSVTDAFNSTATNVGFFERSY
ncbi:phage tail protein [Streptomyces sp. NPDC017448]|uniref:phage tail protein n=1 Tax=Streptomyces sp. NPDC017448 TaxID=3364996 RepID=UPI0037A2D3B0